MIGVSSLFPVSRKLWAETARFPDCQPLSLVAPTEKTVQDGWPLMWLIEYFVEKRQHGVYGKCC